MDVQIYQVFQTKASLRLVSRRKRSMIYQLSVYQRARDRN